MNFLLFILTQACKEFEQRVGQLKSPRGEKTEAVVAAIDRQISGPSALQTCRPHVRALAWI